MQEQRQAKAIARTTTGKSKSENDGSENDGSENDGSKRKNDGRGKSKNGILPIGDPLERSYGRTRTSTPLGAVALR